MPLNPLIPLGVKSLNIGEQINQFASDRQATAEREAAGARQDKLIDIKVDEAEAEKATKRDLDRLESNAIFVEDLLNPALKAGNVDIARKLLTDRAARMAADPDRDNTESLKALKMLDEDPQGLFTLGERVVSQAVLNKLIPDAKANVQETFSPVKDASGRIVGQESSKTGKVVDDPRASDLLTAEELAQKLQIKRAGATNVSVGAGAFSQGGKGVTEGQKKLAELDAKAFDHRRTIAESAVRQQVQVEQIQAASQGFKTGAFGDSRRLAAQVVDFLGLDTGEFAPLIGGAPASAEALEAASANLTTQFVREYDDRINRDELRLIKARGPTLFTTPAGTEIISDIITRQNAKDIAANEFQANWLAKSGGRFRVNPEEAVEFGAVSIDSALSKLERGSTPVFEAIAGKDIAETIASPVITDDIKERLSKTDPSEASGLIKQQTVRERQTIGGVNVNPPPEGSKPPAQSHETKGSAWIGVTDDGDDVFWDGNEVFIVE